MTPLELAQIVEGGEAHAAAATCRAVGPPLATELGLRCAWLGGAAAVGLGADLTLFNRVIGLGVYEPATEALVDAILADYRAAGVRCMIQLSPEARPAALPQWLADRGLTVRDRWVKMYRAAGPAPDIATDLRVTRIGPDRAAVYAATLAAAFALGPAAAQLEPMVAAAVGAPGWSHYLAYDGDVPVAIGALYVEDGIGSLFGGGTRPEARRRGAQGALMARRIADAVARGCRWIVTETGEEQPGEPNSSYHNMLRTGFRLAYLRPNYISMPPPSGD